MNVRGCNIIKKISLFFLFLGVFSALCYSYSDPEWDPVIYSGTFFVLLEDSGPFEPDTFDEESALKTILDEAVWVFSAMIYGFTFEYVPYDAARGVAEEFVLTPVHQLAFGDPSLEIDGGRYSNGIYYVDISYRIRDDQLPWIINWDSNSYPNIISRGEGNLFSGPGGKISAAENTVKQAIRDYLRPRSYDKPRKISGTARLASVPDYSMSAGKYYCTTGVTLDIREILEYKVY